LASDEVQVTEDVPIVGDWGVRDRALRLNVLAIHLPEIALAAAVLTPENVAVAIAIEVTDALDVPVVGDRSVRDSALRKRDDGGSLFPGANALWAVRAGCGSWSDQVAEAARDQPSGPQAHSDDASSRFWRRRTVRSPLYDHPIWMVRESREGADCLIWPGVR
jgi:hypothetical protein